MPEETSTTASDQTPNLGTHGPCNELTAKEYAAIHLRIPKSGTPWIDDMIRESIHNSRVEIVVALLGGHGSAPSDLADLQRKAHGMVGYWMHLDHPRRSPVRNQ